MHANLDKHFNCTSVVKAYGMAFLSRLCNPRGDEIDVDSAPVRSVPLLNSTLQPVPEDRTFTLFSSLPKELRLQIWEEATPRKRLVHVNITPRRNSDGEDEAPVRYLEKNHLGNPISGSGYYLDVEDGLLDHPLLSVNREARQVVLDFYRIHIPASWVGNRPLYPGRELHINPEHDVLEIIAAEPVKRTLIDFLWDLKAYDPKGVGLLKLATTMTEFCLNDLQYLKRSDLLLIRQRQALVDTLSQLQEVWFINNNLHNSLRKRSVADGSDTIAPFGIRMSGYECVGPEPREGAAAELERVYMGSIDPRELIWRWKRLLRTWEVHHPPGQVRYRVIVARQRNCLRKGQKTGRIFGPVRVRLVVGHCQTNLYLRKRP
ncbi:putative pectinesterase precursor [Diaporthe ampelina]|uniref:Putative pectinesterase n=1 Tax=Diaporthe ampelina TaxID=1214573 RepID=A0A0G2HDN8_9PEZI|nr:putative pectinesterase precursor [Diaporthe ampelina]